MNKAWEETIEMPISDRSTKPRSTGLTMVIDKGMGIHRIEDLIQSASEYIDIVKLTFGTSAFYDKEFLKEKNTIITSVDIDVMPGGTFLEIAIWQKKLDEYLDRAKELGFSAIEISDGTIDMDLNTRKNAISTARDRGFKVITEVGKKDPKEAIPLSQVHRLIEEDLSNGAVKVIIEAREAGKGVGIFDADGKIKQDEVEGIISGVKDIDTIMWEAPIKNQQQALIIRCGTNVNLGNIPPDEILALEALRQGVRGDTLKRAYLDNKDWNK
ncbi:MAG TPA: phosphosulfolactate synthase [Candidatus Heimdallarchaeota archaeon]|nr:phosphosulfolactate synthase [Candidatus Heimdallarchaeota archaeon]